MTSSPSSSAAVLVVLAGLAQAGARSPAPAPPALAVPLRCTVGSTCWIQKYPDLAAGPERRDYRCGALTTDAHDGVDLRLASLAQMRGGVAVLAAAAGTVVRVRDGEPDAAAGAAAAGGGREAGNGVVIDHGDGWETQYSHLADRSVRVRPGETVAAGAAIGLVGLSGSTEYPHLHFAVRHRGTTIDPFTGAPVPGACGTAAPGALWTGAARAALAYRTDQLFRVAITSAPPTLADPTPPSLQAPMLVMAEIIGVEAGTVVAFDLRAPDGRQLAQRAVAIDRAMLTWTGYAGRRAPPGGWRRGRYVGTVTLTHRGRPAQRLVAQVAL